MDTASHMSPYKAKTEGSSYAPAVFWCHPGAAVGKGGPASLLCRHDQAKGNCAHPPMGHCTSKVTACQAGSSKAFLGKADYLEVRGLEPQAQSRQDACLFGSWPTPLGSVHSFKTNACRQSQQLHLMLQACACMCVDALPRLQYGLSQKTCNLMFTRADAD
eukprot:scaffold210482_cov18-Tisochrysis_lutea.AAC.2